MRRAKRKRKIGPYQADEIESIQKKPKQKKKKIKLLADEPWLDNVPKQPYFQDSLEKKQNLNKKLEGERKREPWISKERYFQDQFDDDNDDDRKKPIKKQTKRRKKRKKKA
ncbi:MAG: hypothetical protein ACTSQI_18150 [Candidatus Helarchaeota archaeon]